MASRSPALSTASGKSIGEHKEDDRSNSSIPEERADVEKGSHQSAEADGADAFLVSWESSNDKENPRNWTFFKRSWVTLIWIWGNLTTTIASSIFSSGATLIEEEFNVNTVVVTLGVSLFVLGYAIGPPVWGPISERYGRKWPFFVGIVLFTLFCLPVALGQNIQTLLVGRLLNGMFGSAPLAIAGGALGDIWDPVQRGVALAIFIGTIFGSPVLAPLMGNWMAQSYLGWRWDNWLSGIMGLSCIVIVLFLPETSQPSLLRAKAAKLRKSTGDERYRSEFDSQERSFKDTARLYLLRPYVLLANEPILILITIYQAFVYGILYLVFTSYPIAFREVRGWSLGISSLPYLGLSVGILLGAALVVYVTLTSFGKAVRANNGIIVPEKRLPLMMAGAVLIPIGFFIFAWTSAPDIPWPGMVIGSIPLGMGLYMVFVQGFNYIIDVYLQQANSAIGGNTLIRSLFGFAFPLFGPVMYHSLGVAWATSLLGFVSIAMIPIPVLFYIYGKKIRGWSKNSMNKL